jgi:hypothetical protein
MEDVETEIPCRLSNYSVCACLSHWLSLGLPTLTNKEEPVISGIVVSLCSLVGCCGCSLCSRCTLRDLPVVFQRGDVRLWPDNVLNTANRNVAYLIWGLGIVTTLWCFLRLFLRSKVKRSR